MCYMSRMSLFVFYPKLHDFKVLKNAHIKNAPTWPFPFSRTQIKFWKRPCQTEKIITNQRYNTRLIINREKKTSHTLFHNYFLHSNEMYSGQRKLLERHTFSSYEYPFTSGVRTQKLLDISITIQYTLSKLAGKLILHFAIYALIILWISQCLHIEKCPTTQ